MTHGYHSIGEHVCLEAKVVGGCCARIVNAGCCGRRIGDLIHAEFHWNSMGDMNVAVLPVDAILDARDDTVECGG